MAMKSRKAILGKKAMTNLDSVLKGRDITLLTKVHIVKAAVFPVVMYSCESWTVKKAECQRIDAFKLWCWRRLLKGPWPTWRSNQSMVRRSTLNVPTLCDPKDCNTPGLPVPHHLLEFAQVHIHCVSDAIQLSHPLMPISSSIFNLSQHQGFSNELSVHVR